LTLATPRLNRLPAAERGITIGDFLVPIQIGEPVSARMRHILLIVAGALFVALAAQVRIQLPQTPVPITGQTLGVLLVGGALGLRRASLAMLLYLAIGLFLPVYAGGASGLDTFVGQDAAGRWTIGATGGYLIGFVFAAALVGWLAELGWDRRFIGAVGAMVLANLVVYVSGVAWFMVATGRDLAGALTLGVVPFLLADAIKVVLAAVLFPAAWWVVGRRPGER
jgi:biotin transport system substrate-specific component